MLTAQVRRLREWERYLRDNDAPWVELHGGNVRLIADELRDAADTIESLRERCHELQRCELTAEQVKDVYMRHRNECLDFGERKVGWIDWQAIAEELNRVMGA